MELYLMLFVFTSLNTAYDGLALGSKFVSISTIHCKLCQGLWSWSIPPYSQRDMEGSQVLWSAFILEKTFNAKWKVVWCFSWFYDF